MSLVETKSDLLKDLNISESYTPEALEAVTAGESRYLRDVRINLKNALGSENLTPKEAYLIALSIAANQNNKLLSESFAHYAGENGASAADIAEAYSCASMLAVNNVLYRFRHFVKKDSYQNMPAGIKMNVMMSPVLGKELFELISLAVSAVNGCEVCVASHEASLRKLETTEQRIFDAVRLASVVKGLTVIIN